MLSEFELAQLKAHGIDSQDVEGVDSTLVVTFKDGHKEQICEVYTRVMGYYRPQSEFNVGKRQEHADRVLFNEPTEGEVA